jgi:integrase
MRKKVYEMERAARLVSVGKFSKPVTVADINKLTSTQYSLNSALAIKNDWNVFVEFCVSKHVHALPASALTAELFLNSQAQSRKYSSIKRLASSITVVHRFHSLDDPINMKKTRLSMKALELNKLNDAQQATEFTYTHLKTLFKRWHNCDSMKLKRDLLIAALMFELALKRSELRNMKHENISTLNGKLVVSLANNQYQLSDATNDILQEWLLLMGTESGYLFTRIDRHGNFGNEALDSSSIYRIFRNISDELGLVSNLSGQSARVGAAKSLESQGLSLKEITDYGRWVSLAMPAQYLNRSNIAKTESLKFKQIKPWKD